MTKLKSNQIEKFQKIYQETFGIEITNQEALELLTKLVVLGETSLGYK